MLEMLVRILIAAATLATPSSHDGRALPEAAEFAAHPGLVQWIESWSGPDARYSPDQFQFVSSHEHSIWQGYTYPEETNTPAQRRSWVSSPSGAHAVYVSRPGDSPDSEVGLVDLAAERRTAVCTCGTLCTFEIPTWLDAETVLVGAGDWENLAPELVRIDIATGTVERFRGPTVAAEREDDIWRSVQALRDAYFAVSE